MRNLLGFLRSGSEIQKKSEVSPTYVNVGQVQKTEPSQVKRLAGKLKVEEACVVFYATYDNHEGHRDSKPTIVMLHWAKASNAEFSLNQLLQKAIDEENGIGSLTDIRVYIVSHPSNTIGFENNIRDAIGKISKELFLAFQQEKKRFEYDEDMKDDFNSKKIVCNKLQEFEIDNMTALPGEIGVNLSGISIPTEPKPSESPRRLL